MVQNNDKISSIKQRILQFIEYKGITKQNFCDTTGISYSNLRSKSLESEFGGTQITQILSIYDEISSDWLVLGKGEMLRSQASNKEVSTAVKASQGLPLVSLSAIAGFGNENFVITGADVKEYYIVPKFKYCNVDFMIEISGSSMYPKYNSGDVVACTILREHAFIQWNKCHIIATREQGILCKRLRPSQVEGCITAVSDNKNYPPFDIPINEITGIALVVGVIRLE